MSHMAVKGAGSSLPSSQQTPPSTSKRLFSPSRVSLIEVAPVRSTSRRFWTECARLWTGEGLVKEGILPEAYSNSPGLRRISPSSRQPSTDGSARPKPHSAPLQGVSRLYHQPVQPDQSGAPPGTGGQLRARLLLQLVPRQNKGAAEKFGAASRRLWGIERGIVSSVPVLPPVAELGQRTQTPAASDSSCGPSRDRQPKQSDGYRRRLERRCWNGACVCSRPIWREHRGLPPGSRRHRKRTRILWKPENARTGSRLARSRGRARYRSVGDPFQHEARQPGLDELWPGKFWKCWGITR